MRSLPPPRITRARRWKRIKRALKNLFTKGYISDFGVFQKRAWLSRQCHSVSMIGRLPILSRMRKLNSTEDNLVKSANWGFLIAKSFSKLVAKTSLPGLKNDFEERDRWKKTAT